MKTKAWLSFWRNDLVWQYGRRSLHAWKEDESIIERRKALRCWVRPPTTRIELPPLSSLIRNSYEAKHIMFESGHRSESSLRVKSSVLYLNWLLRVLRVYAHHSIFFHPDPATLMYTNLKQFPLSINAMRDSLLFLIQPEEFFIY